MFTDKIYPEYDLIVNANLVEVRTRIRKLHIDGKYYFWNMIIQHEGEDLVAAKECLLNKLIHEAYRVLILGKIDPNLLNYKDDTVIFELDNNQQSEKDRLWEY